MTALLEIARVVHEAVRGYQQALGEAVNPPWDEAPEWARSSTLAGIEGVKAGNTPAEQHAQWCAERTATGWVYGDVKDTVAKTHPCLVPYDELPEEQRRKDALFIAVVNALA